MTFHPEYFNILFELNISDDVKQDMFIEYRNSLLDIVDDTEFSDWLLPQIQAVENISNLHNILKQLDTFDLKNSQANNGMTELLQSLYEEILYVEKESKNTQNIFKLHHLKQLWSQNANIRVVVGIRWNLSVSTVFYKSGKFIRSCRKKYTAF